MWLSWQAAFQIAVPLGVVFLALTWVRWRGAHGSAAPDTRGRMAFARPLLLETTLMFALYGVWQFVHEQAFTKTAGAMNNARALYRFEQRIHLPDELTVQHALNHHRHVMQFLNVYYGGAHVSAVGILLVWLYVRHRDRYSRVRSTLAVTIAGCLAIEIIPVAPPRFLTDLGFVDSALVYGQSVYGGGSGGISNQLAAMPSLHVGWAVLVAIAVVAISTSKWRWLVLAHPILTLIGVTATANHWWLDGVVAVAVMGVAYGVVRAAGMIVAAGRRYLAARSTVRTWRWAR